MSYFLREAAARQLFMRHLVGIGHVLKLNACESRTGIGTRRDDDYLRAPSLKAIISNSALSLQHTCAFARTDALNALKKVVPPFELDLVERTNFGGLSSEVAAYREHMRSSTYVFCPRARRIIVSECMKLSALAESR